MPTIKLKSGSLRIGRSRYTPNSEPFVVSDKMAKLLNCSVVPEPEQPIVPEPTRAHLQELARSLGVDVKPQWSNATLQTKIEAYGQPDVE